MSKNKLTYYFSNRWSKIANCWGLSAPSAT